VCEVTISGGGQGVNSFSGLFLNILRLPSFGYRILQTNSLTTRKSLARRPYSPGISGFGGQILVPIAGDRRKYIAGRGFILVLRKNFRAAPHPSPLPIGWGEGGRRSGEGLPASLPEIIYENHSRIEGRELEGGQTSANSQQPSSTRRLTEMAGE
jgi:hypothetical protein